MGNTELVTGTVGDMILQLAAGVGVDGGPDDPTLFTEIQSVLDSVPTLTALSLADRRAAAGAILADLFWGDANNEDVPGGPHVIRRRAEWVLTPQGRQPLRDPRGVSRALNDAADALELDELTRQHGRS